MTVKLNSMENRCITTSTVGYMCLALTIWMFSMTNAHWYAGFYPHATALVLPMAVVLGIMGILAHLRARSLDAVVFFGAAIFFWSANAAMHAMGHSAAAEPVTYMGWFFGLWAAFFAYVWLGSFRSTLPRQLFLLGLWLALLAIALWGWTGLDVFSYIGGYLGLISAVLAGLVSACGMISFGCEAHNPNDEHVAGAPKVEHVGSAHPAV